LRILLIGDVFGRPGRRAVGQVLPGLRRQLEVDLVVANGENMAGGRGMTRATLAELRQAGVEVITSGNHVWDQREMLTHLDAVEDVLRPLNYPPMAPGRGCWLGSGVIVINVMGRLFMRAIDCPFRAVDRALEQYGQQARVRLVDFHAEATSEKIAMGWHLDGKVSAVVGTHTHVQTADEQIFPGGTAFLCDAGMFGPVNSIIGRAVEPIVQRFMTNLPAQFPVAGGEVRLRGAVVEIDETTGRALRISRIDEAGAPSSEEAQSESALENEYKEEQENG
jgi:metallophosphoesterase (TIGR00282 family)